MEEGRLLSPEEGAALDLADFMPASPYTLDAMMDELMLEFYRERALARPGALEFVQALAERGVRMSVASSSPQPYLQAGLERCGFAPYLDAIVSVDDVGASKREPAVYDHAREAMGTPLAATWGVEDSVYAVRTLKAANYRTLGIYDCDISGTCEQLAAEAERFITTFEDLDVDTFLGWN